MATVKQTERMVKDEGLPRATFPSAATDKKFTRCCVCDAIMLKSNLARHKRMRHAPKKMSPPREEGSETPKHCEVRDPLKLKFNLTVPNEPTEKSSRTGLEAEATGGVMREFMPVPTNEDELMRGLAKLYSARVPKAKPSLLGYNLTRDITEAAQDTNKQHELCEVLNAAGMKVHVEQDWFCMPMKSEDAAVPMEDAAVPGGEKPQPTVVAETSIPQHAATGAVLPLQLPTNDGTWGYKLVPFKCTLETEAPGAAPVEMMSPAPTWSCL